MSRSRQDRLQAFPGIHVFSEPSIDVISRVSPVGIMIRRASLKIAGNFLRISFISGWAHGTLRATWMASNMPGCEGSPEGSKQRPTKTRYPSLTNEGIRLA
jgi:hypothetical protein